MDQFSIQLALDKDEDGATCAGMRCEDYPLGCPIVVGIRVLDPPSADPDEPVGERAPAVCRRPRDPDELAVLCDLAKPRAFDDFPIASDIKPELAQIEFLVWRDVAEDPLKQPVCPEVEFDFAGRPDISDDDPNPPAFGRRVLFDFGGSDPIARVPLACVQPALVDDPSCNPPTTYLRVDVDDIDNLLLGVNADQAPFLSVQVGRPSDRGDGAFEILPEELLDLDRVQVNPEVRPYWERDEVLDTYPVGSAACSIVTDFGSVAAATCTAVPAGESDPPDAVELLGYMVDKEQWDAIRAAIALPSLPDEGLILGRVVDTNMIPLDGAVVTPSDPADELYYLNETLTSAEDGGGAPLTATTASGYFVARGPGFTTTWTAERAGGWKEVGTPTGGALRKSLTVLVIVMSQDLMP